MGRATAYVAAYHGADIAIVDLNAEAAAKTRDEIVKDFSTVKVTSHKCDITDEQAVETLFQDVEKEHSAVHGLAQCAVSRRCISGGIHRADASNRACSDQA